MYKILVIATYDSFLKAGIKIAERINHKTIDIEILNIKKNQLSARQLEQSNADKYSITYTDSFQYQSKYIEYDIIILSVGNIASRNFLREYYQYYENRLIRPIIVSIFAGIIFGNSDSIISKIDSDIILANSEFDRETIENISKIYTKNVRCFNYGLININENLIGMQKNKNHDFYFIDQVKIPYSKQEKEYVVRKLCELAEAYPDRKILIKTRVINNEKTVHDNLFSYNKLFSSISNIPPNIVITAEPIENLFTKMGICISFSSTVLLEAMTYNIQCIALSDLGIQERYGSHFFINSGVMASFNDLILKKSVYLNKSWEYAHLSFPINRDIKLNFIINQAIENSKKSRLVKNNLFGGLIETNTSNKNITIRKIKKFFRTPKQFFLDSKFLKLFKFK